MTLVLDPRPASGRACSGRMKMTRSDLHEAIREGTADLDETGQCALQEPGDA